MQSPCYKCKEKSEGCRHECKKNENWINAEWKRKEAIREQKNCEIFKYLHGRRATQ